MSHGVGRLLGACGLAMAPVTLAVFSTSAHGTQPREVGGKGSKPAEDSSFSAGLGGLRFEAGLRDGRYVIQGPSGKVMHDGPVATQILLREAAFDPLAGPIPQYAHSEMLGSVAGPGQNLFIVQLACPTLEPMVADIEAAGARISRYLPERAFVVQMDRDAAGRVADLPFVRWVGAYEPAYRTDPEIRAMLAGADSSPEGEGSARRYSIMAAFEGEQSQGRIVGRIAALGGAIELVQPETFRMEATLTNAQLVEVLKHPDVLYVDRWSEPQSDMNIVRDLTGANHIESVAGITGQGVRGEVMDSGLLTSHQEYAGRAPLIHAGNSGDPFHGTQCYSIVFAQGTNPLARGLLPSGNGIFASYSNVPNRYTHTQQLRQSPYFAVFQSNSWGNDRVRNYTTISAEFDDILFDSDVVICQSQSNAGNQDSRPQAWAKNVISVGGVNHRNTLSTADDAWSFSGSTGPAIDGRFKPDVSHFYDGVRAASNVGVSSYEDFGGTSAATPIVSGHVGLMHQMWALGLFGNPVSGGTVFEERPHAITAKAIMINSARQYTFNNGAEDFGRVRQGWGLPDLQRLYDFRERMYVVDESDVLAALQHTSHSVTVAPGEPSLRVTLAFADPAGNPAAAWARVNDLDLTVVSPSGIVYRGNVGLRDGRWSEPGGEPNRVDTVENILIQNPEAGDWQIDVLAREVNQDGHPETPGLDADYALVVGGAVAAPSGLTIVPAANLPEAIAPDGSTVVQARVEGNLPITLVELRIARPGGGFTTVPMTPVGGSVFEATMPSAPCGGVVSYHFAASDANATVFSPSGAPAALYQAEVGAVATITSHDFNASSAGWTVTNTSLVDGPWGWGTPAGGGLRHDPIRAFNGSGACWLTDNVAGNSDVDGGPTTLTSIAYDLSGATDPVISVQTWLSCDDASTSAEDRMTIQISANGGAAWTTMEVLRSTWDWRPRRYRVADFITPSNQVMVRFQVSDPANDSATEAAIDEFRILDVVCEFCAADLSGSSDPNDPAYGVPDGITDAADFFFYLDQFAAINLAIADLSSSSDPNDTGYGVPDGAIDASDFFYYLDLFVAGCP